MPNLASTSNLIPAIHTQGALTPDIIGVGVLFVLIAAAGYQMGVGRVIAVALSFLVASLLSTAITSAAFIGPSVSNMTTGKFGPVALLVGLAVVSFFALKRLLAADSTAVGMILEALLASIGTLCVVAFLVITHDPTGALFTHGPLLSMALKPSYAFWWLIGALATLSTSRGSSYF